MEYICIYICVCVGRHILIDANRQTLVSYLTFAHRICSVNASKKQSWAAEKWSPFKLTILRGVNTLGNVAQGNIYWDRSVHDGVEWPCDRSSSV